MTTNTLDDLKAKAERDAGADELTRRPTWAPLILLGEELLLIAYDLEWLTADDLAVGRLWARFTDPRRGAVRCEGFELRAGRAHNGKEIWYGQYFDKSRAIANVRRLLETAREPDARERLQLFLHETEAKTGGWTFGPRWTRYHHSGRDVLPQVHRAVELGQARVMEFAGAPDEQMREAGRYCGHCWRCGKALTDPHSIELGIGPECIRIVGASAEQAPGALIIGGANA